MSQLKKATFEASQVKFVPLILSSTLEWITKPEDIMDIRRASKGGYPEVLVHWKGLPAFELTWEPMTRLADQYP